MKKIFIFILLVLAVPVTMMADDPVEIGGIYYNLIKKGNNAIAKVTRISNYYYSGDIVIPSTVTHEGVPYTVKEIGNGAFYSCSSLTSITIPESVTSIESCAISNCPNLTSIYIPSSVTSIGTRNFQCCSSISVDPNNTIYDSRNNCNAIIEAASKTLINGCKETIIPSSVTSIGEQAFFSSSLISIDIPVGVTSIGEEAFMYCNNLTSIDVPNSVTSIGSEAFYQCTSLTSIDISDGVTSIGERAFKGCSVLTSINIPESVKRIGEYAFDGCTSLTSIDIPNGVTCIERYTFNDCKSLTSIVIPDGVTSIETWAFHGCTSLTSIIIPNSVTFINDGAFRDCHPTYFEYHCNCGLFKYKYGDKESDLNLHDCETLVIGDEVNEVKLKDYMYIKNLIVGARTLGYFYNLPNLENVTITSGTSIIDNNFYNCPNLKKVTIGTGVTNIDNSFNNCENLDVVTSLATTPPAASSSFDGSYIEYATLIVPDEAYTAYSTTEPWSNFGTILKASQISTVTAKDYTREYGDANPNEWEYTVVGQDLVGEPTRSCSADETSAPGTYPIVISQGTVTNEHVTYVNGMLTITKAPLTITANSYTIKEGDALPSYDAVFTGLKNNEQESVVSPVVSCTAADSNTPGTYDITVTATSDNYDITIEQGTLTILPTSNEITIPEEGMTTYCPSYNLDFSGVTDFKAYIIVGYNKKTNKVIAVEVDEAPAGTGLYLAGTPGTYQVPLGESGTYYMNMLKGVTTATTIPATNGDFANLTLSSATTPTFAPASDGSSVDANTAYLQIETAKYNGQSIELLLMDKELLGDINKDGNVTIVDVMMVVDIILNQ